MTVLEQWHHVVATRDTEALRALLAEDAVFHSPVVHSPQQGSAVVYQYLAAALEVLLDPSFRYVREITDEQEAVLEFEVELDGVHVNGVDMIRWDDAGRIVDFKVMLRPLKAIQLIHEKMGARLRSAS